MIDSLSLKTTTFKTASLSIIHDFLFMYNRKGCSSFGGVFKIIFPSLIWIYALINDRHTIPNHFHPALQEWYIVHQKV